MEDTAATPKTQLDAIQASLDDLAKATGADKLDSLEAKLSVLEESYKTLADGKWEPKRDVWAFLKGLAVVGGYLAAGAALWASIFG